VPLVEAIDDGADDLRKVAMSYVFEYQQRCFDIPSR